MQGRSALLPDLPHDLILACYAQAPGNEIESGKFESPESSAALVANTFGYFLDKATALPPLRGVGCTWPAVKIALEGVVKFPWHGGRHPCLDVLIETRDALIGIESKRFEPYRAKQRAALSKAYGRDVWGNRMVGFTSVREAFEKGEEFAHLDAAQLIKHAYGLRSAVAAAGPLAGRRPFLIYLHGEPAAWPDGKKISPVAHSKHRDELSRFASRVSGDEVTFLSMTYADLLSGWRVGSSAQLAEHADRISQRFFPEVVECESP